MAWILFGWLGVSLMGVVVFAVLRLRYRPVTVPPEVREFVRELEEDIALNHPTVEVCGMVPGRFAAVLSLRGQELPVSLHHLFRRCTAFPERFSESVAQFLRELEQDGLDQPADHSFAEAAEQLLPQVRSLAWVEEHGGRFGDSALVHRPFHDDLAICYVIDDPWCMTFVCRAHLAQWGRTEDDLYHLASRNLQRKAEADVPLPTVDDGPVLLRSGDGFDATRVLLLDPERVEGLLVAMPERDALWLGQENERDLGQLMVLNERQAAEAPHPVSSRVYRMTNGQLVPVNADDSGS